MSGLFDQGDIDRIARDAVADVGREFQSEMDALAGTHGGQPVEQVKPALRASLRRIDIEADEDEIADWSQAISDGDRIVAEWD